MYECCHLYTQGYVITSKCCHCCRLHKCWHLAYVLALCISVATMSHCISAGIVCKCCHYGIEYTCNVRTLGEITGSKDNTPKWSNYLKVGVQCIYLAQAEVETWGLCDPVALSFQGESDFPSQYKYKQMITTTITYFGYYCFAQPPHKQRYDFCPHFSFILTRA